MLDGMIREDDDVFQPNYEEEIQRYIDNYPVFETVFEIQNGVLVSPAEIEQNFCQKIYRNPFRSVLSLLAFFAVTRNGAGAYQLALRFLNHYENCPPALKVFCGLALGGLASVSPLHQIRNGVDQLYKYYDENKYAAQKLFFAWLIVGSWSGFSFAEMGSDATNSLFEDWGWQKGFSLDLFVKSIWGMTFASQSLTFTVKILNLNLLDLFKQLKRNPIVFFPLVANLFISIAGVYTNQVFGAMATAKYFKQPVVYQALGVLGAAGPAAMNVESFNNMGNSFVDHFCDEGEIKVDGAPLIGVTENKSMVKVNFSFRYLGIWAVMSCIFWALVSATPSIEYSFEANKLEGGLFMTLIFCGIICNFFPKFTGSLEHAYKAKINKEKQIELKPASPSEIKINGDSKLNEHSFYSSRRHDSASLPSRSCQCIIL